MAASKPNAKAKSQATPKKSKPKSPATSAKKSKPKSTAGSQAKSASVAPQTEINDPVVVVEFSDYERMRWPLTALTILTPLALFAEIWRFIAERQAELLAEPHLRELTMHLGMDSHLAPLAPAVLLIVGCLIAHLARRLPWALPDLLLTGQIILWAAIWAVVRYALSFTSVTISGVHHIADGDVGRIEFLAQLGLAMSGAVQEEVIFRAGLLGGLAWIATALAKGRAWPAWCIALPVSAVIFALVHTSVINPGAPDPSMPVITVHLIGGLLYGLIFLRQGLTVVTLAHLGYNLMVMLLPAP